MKYQRWNIAGACNDPDAEHLAESGYSYLLSLVLSARGIRTAEQAAAALERERHLTHSPMLMRDMDKAVERIQRAIRDDELVAVYGDYDVDGITSTCLVMDYLRRTGCRCLRYIPRRIEDGYGLSCDAIDALHAQGATLLVTVDCGITGVEEAAYAKTLGMDVVITDHHECKDTLPDAVAVVAPSSTWPAWAWR